MKRSQVKVKVGRSLTELAFGMRYTQTNRRILEVVQGHISSVFWATFVKRFALCYQTVVCSACLSVSPVCNVGVLWPNGWTDQDETWHTSRPRPWPHCVRWAPSSPSLKGAQPPIFGPYPLRPNGCIDQDATWYGGRPRPRRLFIIIIIIIKVCY